MPVQGEPLDLNHPVYDGVEPYRPLGLVEDIQAQARQFPVGEEQPTLVSVMPTSAFSSARQFPVGEEQPTAPRRG